MTLRIWSRIDPARIRVKLLKGPKGKPDANALAIVDGVVVGTPARASRGGLAWWPHAREGKDVAEPIVVDGVKGLHSCGGGAGGVLVANLDRRMSREAWVVMRGSDGASWTAASLHRKPWTSTFVSASDGRRHVGWGERKDLRDVALVWRGAGDDVTELAGVRGSDTNAYALGGDVVVGAEGKPSERHAMLWRGNDAVDLHPAELARFGSEAKGCDRIDGAEQVGNGWPKMTEQRALLWRGTAASCVDLTPRGVKSAAATACAGGAQAGWVDRGSAEQSMTRATLWGGAADACIDLHELVPAPFTTSAAWAVAVVDDTLLVAGGCMEYVQEERYHVNRSERAVLWEIPLAR